MVTDKQAIVHAEEELGLKKQAYMAALTPVVQAVQVDNADPTLIQLLNCQRLGNEYFNFAEQLVGDSGLLGAHRSGTWVTGFAETCYSVLDALLDHISFLRSHSKIIGRSAVEPSRNSYANMQRMVKEYLPPEESDELQARYESAGLPVTGFLRPAIEDSHEFPKWQTTATFIVGIVLILYVLITATFIDTPSHWQQFVMRGAFAIGLPAFASAIPGFIKVKWRYRTQKQYFTILAGGAIALFVIVWLITPPNV